MEQYKLKLKRRLLYYSLLCLLCFIFLTVVWIQRLDIQRFSFFFGLFASFSAVMLIWVIQGVMRLKDEERLKKMYIKESDERNQMVAMKALSASFRIFILLYVLIVIGYAFVDVEKALLLSQVMCIAPLVQGATYIYYSKKL